MAIQEVLVSKIFNYTSEPTKKVEGQFWFNPSTNVLSRYNGTAWKAITVSSDDVAVLSDGSKISLTNYLNTQIAALAEGIDTKQDKLLYYSEVSGSTPSATISVANIKLTGKVSEGTGTTASGNYSHAEGDSTTASGTRSHAEGRNTTAEGNDGSHAEGAYTTASGVCSHAEGSFTTASGSSSHAEGRYTTASSASQHAQGKFNIEDANDKYADIIGNGTSNTARSNAATVSWNGISWSQTDVRAGGTNQDNATYSLSALAEGVNNKQNKLNFYSEEGEGYLAEANISNTAHINFDAYDSDGGGRINITSSSAAPVTSNITLEARSNSSMTYSKIVLDSGTSTSPASITIDGELTGSAISTSIPSSNAVDTKVTSEKAVATAISGKADKATTLAGYNIGDAYTKTEVNTELGKKQDKLITYSESDSGVEISDIYVNITAGDVLTLLGQTSINLTTNNTPSSDIKLEANDQSITLNSGYEGTEGSITVNGNITGTAISTSIPASESAVDTKVVSEKAVKTELDKKQNKLLYYSEVSGSTPSATISVGVGCKINLDGNVAEGDSTTASGMVSHAEGFVTLASGNFSHAEGNNAIASGECQHVQGKYNIEDANNKYADIIGNGSAETNRSNAQTVSWEGISWSKTDVRAGGTDQDSATHSLSAKQNVTDNNLTTIDKTIVGAINGLNTRIDNSSGMLYFTGGSNKYGTGTFSAGEVFSIAYRTDFQFDYDSASSGQYRPWSVGNPASNNISITALGDDRLRVLYNGGGFCGYRGTNIRSVIKPINDIVVIVTNPTGGNMNTSLYVNGVQIPQASYKAQPSLEMTGYRLNAMNYAAALIDTTMKDFAIFNFDMSAADAPYSVADYLAGKPVPPSLKRNGGIFSSDPNMGASTSGGWAINTPDGSAIVTSGAWRCFSAVYYCYNRTGDLPAGVEYAIDLSTKVSSEATGDAFLCNIGQGSFARFNSSRFKGRVSFWYRKNNTDTSASSTLSVQIAKLIIASVSGANVSDNDWHFFSEEIDMTLTDIATGGFLAVSSYATSGTFTDYPWSIADLNLESYTQEVGLENYTFTVGSTQYIPDASGNNHDITMSSTGIVAGTFDASIAKLASLIASANA